MLRRSKIGWCDYSGGSLNFIIGCTPVSEGCKNCYGADWAKRVGRDYSNITTYWQKLNRLWKAKWEPGDVPYRRGPGSKPIMFPCDLSDLFHEDVEDELKFTALDIFAARDDADWVLLTKRPGEMLDVTNYWLGFCDLEQLPSNIWCLVTAENQQRADERLPILLQVRAQVRGVSIEPMLGPIDLGRLRKHKFGRFPEECNHRGMGGQCINPVHWAEIGWIIVGAESGPRRRLFNTLWAEDLWRQCQAAGVPFFGKQASGLRPGVPLYIRGREIKEFPKT